MTWQVARLCFDKAHPTAAGHFPGDPMLPGAAMLDAVIVAIAGAQCDAPMLIHSAKFLHIVRPGEALDLRWQPMPGGGVSFEGRVADRLAVTGRLEMEP